MTAAEKAFEPSGLSLQRDVLYPPHSMSRGELFEGDIVAKHLNRGRRKNNLRRKL